MSVPTGEGGSARTENLFPLVNENCVATYCYEFIIRGCC